MTNETDRKIARALISVYRKDGLAPLLKTLQSMGIEMLSTGGTQRFIEEAGYACGKVEDLTGYPSILGGRVKTLHPAICGAILARRDNPGDQAEMQQYALKPIDLVIVDLYPFEEALRAGASEEELIEKIDIGGVTLIRAAAKNYRDVAVIASRAEIEPFCQTLVASNGVLTLEDRRRMAARALMHIAAYDQAISGYFNASDEATADLHPNGLGAAQTLRYGENPHQKGYFFPPREPLYEQIQGKELSYNNLRDVDAAMQLIAEFPDTPCFAVIKHMNPCGIALGKNVAEAWLRAYGADKESAFGGILICNRTIDEEVAKAVSELFFEVLIAPDYAPEALDLFAKKSKRIVLKQIGSVDSALCYTSALNGMMCQERDAVNDTEHHLVTRKAATQAETDDMLFAMKVVKHCKSNAIALAKDGMLLANGIGQTSRIAALQQAIDKAKRNGFDLHGAVMASDAFFPFGDCVTAAAHEGITAIIQPGGSIRDRESIEAADELGVAMLFTGRRHFRH